MRVVRLLCITATLVCVAVPNALAAGVKGEPVYRGPLPTVTTAQAGNGFDWTLAIVFALAIAAALIIGVFIGSKWHRIGSVRGAVPAKAT